MSGLPGSSLNRATIKGTPGRDLVNKAKSEVFGDDDAEKRRKARRAASPLTEGQFNINQGLNAV